MLNYDCDYNFQFSIFGAFERKSSQGFSNVNSACFLD